MRRPLACIGCVAIAAAAAVLGMQFAVGDSHTEKPQVRKFKFTYWLKLPAPAEGSKKLEGWIPVAREDDLQKVTDLKVDTGCPNKVETDEYGNRMIHFTVENPKGETAIGWTATITRTADRGQGAAKAHRRFLEADQLNPLTGRATDISTELKAKDAAKPVGDRSKAIYDYVLTTTKYSKDGEGWGEGDFERACTLRAGNCTDFHAKFIGIARASGIPSRFTMGYSIPTDKPKGEIKGYHCWAHYQDGDKWVPVDISEAQKVVEKDPAKAAWFFKNLDADRMAVTVGRDLTLVPKQQGGPVAQFTYQYVEVDGKPIEVAKEARGFAYENVPE
jgi:transglutaminase-like putative cysteine protease